MAAPDVVDSEDFSPLVGKLAGRPSLVVMVTFAVAAVVTVGLSIASHGMDASAVISLLATIWALALALVIYLLTAKDTDKLLASIDALQDQLSAALEAPGPQALVETKASGRPSKADHPSSRQEESSHASPADQRPFSLPPDYLDALSRRTGLVVDRIKRAWTPNPSGAGPWVIESDTGDRWSIFRGRHGLTTVIPLGNADRARQRHEMAEAHRTATQEAKRQRHRGDAAEAKKTDR